MVLLSDTTEVMCRLRQKPLQLYRSKVVSQERRLVSNFLLLSVGCSLAAAVRFVESATDRYRSFNLTYARALGAYNKGHQF